MSELFEDINQHLQDTKKPTLLSEAQVERLIISLATSRGEEGFTEDECVAVVKWAENTVVAQGMLDLILAGECEINWKDDEVVIGLSEARKQFLRDGSDI